ncbi:MAG: outer membrane protein assembly factor BamA [Thiomonas sp. 13-66-29]|uniref:Outer membrane protein assembly factor BamA n=1 Tax=Thiomonas delicata TaxID=364030 RepID=A0A238D8S7_THIDL|nr:MAG: outer membrane protein assembly factor BamA [Thiomonas sp. 13-66-29]SBP89580.1 putative Bacterial surface antigen (D15) [Thiomonas delicata]
MRFRHALQGTAVAVLAVACAQAYAADTFIIKDIRVDGLQRTEPGTVFSYLPFRVGDTYTPENGAAAIRALFATGLFKDVRIRTDHDVVTIIVEERPVIANVDFTGTKEFPKKTLIEALSQVGLGEAHPYDQALVDRAVQELKQQYLAKGYYGVEVSTTVTPLERNRVNVLFNVTEGAIAKIRAIRIVGNKVYSESDLRDLFSLSTPGWLSWYTKSDQYSRAKLNADLETLRSYYLDRGYLDFRIESTQVELSPDKDSIYITVNIHEGPKYTVSGYKLEGNYLGLDDEFRPLVKLKPGDVYSAKLLNESVKAMVDKFGVYGYAFARVEPKPEIDHDTHEVFFTIDSDPGRRIYVRKIDISGNTRTRDEVIRREFRQFEDAWYDVDRIKLSRDRVDRLGYFKDVTLGTREVPGTSDQVDLDMHVTEKPTGMLGLGVGFSSANHLSFNASVSQDNIFGSGNNLSVDFNTSSYYRTLAVSSTNPYFTQDGISRTVNVYYRTIQPYSSQGNNYTIKTPGFNVQFGVPFTELDRVFFGVGFERYTLDLSPGAPAAYISYVNQFGQTSSGVPLTIGWQRDSRNSALVPTDGRYQRLSVEYSPFSTLRYFRSTYEYQQFLPVTRQTNLAFNGLLGYAHGLNGQPLPIFKNLYAGGIGTVRGFQQSSLGPQDAQGNALGGAKLLVADLEYQFPFPGTGADKSLRMSTFLDSGYVWGENQKVSLADMRASVGIAVSWISPIGPLKFSIAKPIRSQPGDKLQAFQFTVGTAF